MIAWVEILMSLRR